MRGALAELVFMMVILKLPVVYLCGVVWWAIRAEPRPFEGSALPAEPSRPVCPWRPPRPGPRLPPGASRRTRMAPRSTVSS